MRIKEYVAKYGAKKSAKTLSQAVFIVSYYLSKHGVKMEDMPETPALCDILDEIEDIISKKEIDYDALQDALDCLRDDDYIFDMLR
jgi:hypothetical protein